VIKKEIEINNDIIQKIGDQMDLINQTIAKTNQSHKKFQATNKQIQYVGVIMIIFIFFLLLLKQYDLYDSLNDIILHPFKFFQK
jgi:hypothetical protein